jgi:hypothetical protein
MASRTMLFEPWLLAASCLFRGEARGEPAPLGYAPELLPKVQPLEGSQPAPTRAQIGIYWQGKGAAKCLGRVLPNGFCASYLFAAPV